MVSESLGLIHRSIGLFANHKLFQNGETTRYHIVLDRTLSCPTRSYPFVLYGVLIYDVATFCKIVFSDEMLGVIQSGLYLRFQPNRYARLRTRQGRECKRLLQSLFRSAALVRDTIVVVPRSHRLIGAGKIIARKNGRRTLVDVGSADAHFAALPLAEIKAPKPTKPSPPIQPAE